MGNNDGIVAYIKPAHEPTEHLLRELLAAKFPTGMKIVLAAQSTNDSLSNVLNKLSDHAVFINTDEGFAEFLGKATGLGSANLPILTFIKNRQACYYVKGYHAGSVKRLLEAM